MKLESVAIAEVRAALNKIIYNPELSISVTETLLRAAHLEASMLASQQLEKDLQSIKKEENNNGIQSDTV